MRNIQRGISTLFLVVGILGITIAAASTYFIFSNTLQKRSQQKQQVISSLGPEQTMNQEVIASPTPSTKDETANWKTYTNNIYRFEVKYPPEYYIAKNGGEGKEYPKFIPPDAKDYEPPGLTLEFEPESYYDLPRYKVQSRSFDIQNLQDNLYVSIYFVDENGRKVYATCTVYNKDDKMLRFCNKILSTYRSLK